MSIIGCFKYIRNLAKVYIKLAELDKQTQKIQKNHYNCVCNLKIQKYLEMLLKLTFYQEISHYKMIQKEKKKKHQVFFESSSDIRNSFMQNNQQRIKINTYDRQHFKLSFLDNDDIKELKQVLSMLYDKIEDTNVAQKEIQSDEWMKTPYEMLNKAQLLQQQQIQQQQFTQQPIQEERQIISLGNFRNARRKLDIVKQQSQNIVVQGNNQEKQEINQSDEQCASKKVKID
ncbi:unnamed protein product [Paramecium primaurelia]|uniref:Uncharacterized protein n=1 Tax=Paramecium primaurelia TaxID=5886 RepID=A0A8S1N8F3_PARPR|nr:unnamed protein product [Paramecium primaurelia]